MADTLTTLAELARFNSMDVNPAEISDVLNSAPVLASLHAMQSSNGTTHKYNKETTAPVVTFRAVNAGADYTAGISSQVSATLEYLDLKVIEDAAQCRAYKNGAEAWLNNRTRRVLRAGLFATEKQIFNGTVHGDSAGFTGLANGTDYDGAGDSLVVNAGGTTESTASSVWAIRSTVDDESAALVGAGDEGLDVENINFLIGETFSSIVTGSNSKSMAALCRDIGAHLGLQIGSKYAVARIANLTEDSGKGLTDTLMSQLYELFPADAPPTLFAMSRRSRGQLQRSRTTYSPTGAHAPIPTMWENVPIIATDAITDSETLLV